MSSTFTDPRIDDPEAALARDVERSPNATLRREVLAELKVQIDRPDVVLEVPTRPGWSVRFTTRLDADFLAAWTKQASTRDGLDQFRLSLLTVAGLCRGLVRNGEEVTANGQTVTFTSPELGDLYGTVDAASTVRAFYGDDVVVSNTYLALLEACGSGNRVVTVDPTTGSSD